MSRSGALLVPLAVVHLAATPVGAEPVVPPSPRSAAATADHSRETTLVAQRQRGRIERGCGVGLAAVGVAAAIVGGTFLGVAGQAPYADGSRFQVAGGATLAASVAFLLPGAVLAVLGQNAVSAADWRLRAVRQVYVIPLAEGGAVAGLATGF
jgi:hypothetical protein